MTDQRPSGNGSDGRARFVRRRVAVAVSVVLVAFAAWAGGWYVGVRAGWWPAPSSATSRQSSWWFGFQEEAYHFGEVVPGRIYRSGRVDEKFYRYVHEKYGVRHVVCLMGPAGPAPPVGLGIDRTIYHWQTDTPPPREELAHVLAVMKSRQPVLVHCWAGIDRTGYAVAAYRILEQGRPVDEAIAEMDRYHHKAYKRPAMQADLRVLGRVGNLKNAPATRPSSR